MWSKEKVRVTSWTLVGSMWECLCGHHRPTPRHSNGQKHKWHWKPLKAKTKVGIHSKWTILVGLCRIYGLCKLFRAMRKRIEILILICKLSYPFISLWEKCLWSFVDLLFMRPSVDQMERVSEDLIAMADHNSLPAKWQPLQKVVWISSNYGCDAPYIHAICATSFSIAQR